MALCHATLRYEIVTSVAISISIEIMGMLLHSLAVMVLGLFRSVLLREIDRLMCLVNIVGYQTRVVIRFQQLMELLNIGLVGSELFI